MAPSRRIDIFEEPGEPVKAVIEDCGVVMPVGVE
jgi:hypothetical protein